MKRVLKIVAIGICLGLFLVVIQRSLQIDKDTFMRSYWIIAPAIVVGAVLFNVFYNISYQRKMCRIAALLDAGEAGKYIAEVEKLLQTAKGENLRNILKLNLAAGYIDTKQYDPAISMLEDLSNERLLSPTVKMICRLNLCMSYFYSEQYEKAMELYNDSQTIFGTYRNNKTYGGNIAVVDIFAAIGSERYEQAEKLLAAAQKSWSSPRLQDTFQMIDDFLLETKSQRSK